MVLEKTLESPLYCKEIQLVHAKGNQSWVFIGRTDVEAETPIFWPPDVKSWLIWKDPDVGKDWKQEEKGMTEDEMVRWHHWLNGHGLDRLWVLVIDREAWCAAVHGVTKSRVWVRDCTKMKNTAARGLRGGRGRAHHPYPAALHPHSSLGLQLLAALLMGQLTLLSYFLQCQNLFFFCLIRHNNHVRERLSHYKKNIKLTYSF